MQNLFNKSYQFSHKLIKQTNQLNYDLFDRLKEKRTFTLFTSSSNQLLTSSLNQLSTKSSNQLSTKSLNKFTNYLAINSVYHQSKHAYSPFTNEDESSCDLLSKKFKTTELSVSESPELYLSKTLETKILRKLERKHLRSLERKKMYSKNVNTSNSSKWHLKNVLYLLKNHYEEEEEDKKFKNANKFNFSIDFRTVNQAWECCITIFHPNRQEFRSINRRKTDAEEDASTYALEWLKQQNIINSENKLIVLQKQKLKKQIDSKKGILEPLNVNKFNSAQRRYMDDFIDTFELKHRPLLENEIDLYISNELNRQTLNYQNSKYIDEFYNGSSEDFNSAQHDLNNMVSGRKLKKLSPRDQDRINSQLSNFLYQRENISPDDHSFDTYLDYKHKLRNLPIHSYREQLLDLIFDNQVVVISGETGCGKTTQIPQYILEDMIRGGCGAGCSIIVTQPRRLPAISVCEQTALQFGERMVGNSFGYQVRFERELPIRDNGVVLFCTTGMLLRKMSGNPYLVGVSHLILDEVHEREFLADLTLILLKKILEKNDQIKIILMSASLNAEVFSSFFKNCPIFKIPGRCFPVESIYLNQIENEMRPLKSNKNASKTSNDKKVDYDLVNDLIHHINNTEQGSDSVLCFLPGWNDIKKVKENLEKTNHLVRSNSPALSIIPVHSKLTSEEQKAIFRPLQAGLRKIILSTNIAETSLTVPDVVYVIDPGLCNETYYNKEYNVSTFGTHLISQANAKQREGRAGRVKPGVCYKLYTKETEINQMLKYHLPEILRIPLETAVMYSKLYCPDEKADDFLSSALEPPSKSAILSAVETLKLINVLDDDEHLTLMGRKIVDLSTHPRLSVCLITSAMLGCFNQVLGLCSVLSQAKDPFNLMPGNRSLVKNIKESISNNSSSNFLSDYIPLNTLLQMYESTKNSYDEDIDAQLLFDEYRQYINLGTLESARHLKKLFLADLAENGIGDDEMMDFSSLFSNCLFDLTLLSGLYPNVLKYVNEKNSQKFQLIDVNTGHQTAYSSESILSTVRIDDESHYVSIYFESYYSEDRKRLMIKNATLLPSIYVLFACKNLKLVKEEGSMVTFILDDCKFLIFTMDKQDLSMILKWKDIMKVYQNWYLCNNGNESSQFIYLKKTFKEFLDLTNKVFDRYSKGSEIQNFREPLI